MYLNTRSTRRSSAAWPPTQPPRASTQCNFLYLSIYLSIHLYSYVCIHVCKYIAICIYKHTIYASLVGSLATDAASARKYAMQLYIYICLYVYVYIYMYVYINTRFTRRSSAAWQPTQPQRAST